jgi:hypothetical protein
MPCSCDRGDRDSCAEQHRDNTDPRRPVKLHRCEDPRRVPNKPQSWLLWPLAVATLSLRPEGAPDDQRP